jgi:predicted Holliday junction resolvase-like endonuclease
MSLLLLASISTLLVIIFATVAYIVNVQKINKIQSDYDSKMQDMIDQLNKNQYYNYQFDKRQEALINKNTSAIVALQEREPVNKMI